MYVIKAFDIRLENGSIIYTDPTLQDSDGDGLLDNKRVYYNGTVMLSIDPNPLAVDGPDGVWMEQSKQNNFNLPRRRIYPAPFSFPLQKPLIQRIIPTRIKFGGAK